MKKKIKSIIIIGVLLLTLCIPINAQNMPQPPLESVQDFTITYEFTSPIIEKISYKGTTYDNIIIHGTERIGSIGEPILPMKSAYILLPPNTEIDDISVTGEPTTLKGTYTLVIVRSYQKEPYLITNTHQQTQYPQSLFKNSGTFQFRGYNILFLNLYPIQYQIQSKQLIFYSSLDVSISIKQTSQDTTCYRNLEQDKNTATMLIDNPEIINSYHSNNQYNANYNGEDLLIITRDDIK